MIEFIAAVYNEEDEIYDLLRHVSPYVDRINIVDDESLDDTYDKLVDLSEYQSDVSILSNINVKRIRHTGLPETVKAQALKMCADDSWVIMLDADERFGPNVLRSIRLFLRRNEESKDVDYVYSPQLEIIDGQVVRSFQKCKVFRKSAMSFPLNNIHADDVLSGRGVYKPDWIVYHRKSSDKQRHREEEYLQTYKRLLLEGKIDQGRYEWLVNLHHYVKM